MGTTPHATTSTTPADAPGPMDHTSDLGSNGPEDDGKTSAGMTGETPAGRAVCVPHTADHGERTMLPAQTVLTIMLGIEYTVIIAAMTILVGFGPTGQAGETAHTTMTWAGRLLAATAIAILATIIIRLVRTRRNGSDGPRKDIRSNGPQEERNQQ